MAKINGRSGDVGADVKPASVVITVKRFCNVIPSDGGENGVAMVKDIPPQNGQVEKRDSEVSPIVNESDVAQLSNGFDREHSKDVLQTDAQKFQANEKISKVLLDSGSFDSINDAQVLKHRLRTLEIEKLALMVDHNNLIREFNKSVESHLEEIKKLNEINEQDQHEIQELRDLTCFLDDERKKYKKIAKEWQRFGRQTVHAFKNEIVSYKERLNVAEQKEKMLIIENRELRDLCMHLDQEMSTLVTGTNNHESNIKLTKDCLQCSEAQNNARKVQLGGGVSKTLGDICEQSVWAHSSPKYSSKNDDMLLHLKTAQNELQKNIQMLRNDDNRNEKKKVKFDFPDDSDTSTASDIDTLEFPPRIAEFEKISKMGKVFPELNKTAESAPLRESVPSKTNMLMKFEEENLSNDHLFFPSSPMKPDLNGKVSRHIKNTNTIQEKDELTDSDISTTSTSTYPPVFHDDEDICTRRKGKSEKNSFKNGFNQDPFDDVERSKYI